MKTIMNKRDSEKELVRENAIKQRLIQMVTSLVSLLKLTRFLST